MAQNGKVVFTFTFQLMDSLTRNRTRKSSAAEREAAQFCSLSQLRRQGSAARALHHSTSLQGCGGESQPAGLGSSYNAGVLPQAEISSVNPGQCYVERESWHPGKLRPEY